MMTKKDFEQVAKTINLAREYALHPTDIRMTAFALAGTFGMMNPRFDDARFIKACGFDMNDLAVGTTELEVWVGNRYARLLWRNPETNAWSLWFARGHRGERARFNAAEAAKFHSVQSLPTTQATQ